jgi:hypothetical protein
MKNYNSVLGVFVALPTLVLGARIARSQDNPAPNLLQVHMVITGEGLRDIETPVIGLSAIQVKQRADLRKVTQLIPARDDNAALQLFVLIDDTCDPSSGNNLNDLRDFIGAQPTSTSFRTRTAILPQLSASPCETNPKSSYDPVFRFYAVYSSVGMSLFCGSIENSRASMVR